MKAVIKSIKFMSASLVFLALAACGKSDGGNNVAAVQYGIQNGSCYDITHNTPATYNLCPGVGTAGQSQYGYGQGQGYGPGYGQGQGYGSGYGYGYGYGDNTLPNGQGYAEYWGTNNYPSTYGGGPYGGVQSCVGIYYEYGGYTARLVRCDGYSCRGQFLYNQSTKTRVLCQ